MALNSSVYLSYLSNLTDYSYDYSEDIHNDYLSFIKDTNRTFEVDFVNDTLPPEGKDIPARVTLAFVYFLILLVCGVGNALLLLVLYKYQQTRGSTNLLIANLALSDLIVAVLCIPFNMDYFVFKMRGWTHGSFMCATVNYVRMVSLYVSTNALLVITVERYIVIVHEIQRRISRKGVCMVSGLVWLVSMVIAVPSAMYSRVVSYDHRDGAICGQIWPVSLESTSQGYYVFVVVVQFVLPVCIMCFCYFRVIWKVWRRRFPGQISRAQRRTHRRSKVKTMRLVIMLLTFILCWGPYYAYTIIRDFFPALSLQMNKTVTVFYVVEAVAMVNSVINTCVYVAFNDNILKYIRKMLPFGTGVQTSIVSESTLPRGSRTARNRQTVVSSRRGTVVTVKRARTQTP
ncbi:PREDICTED: prokineticin receptor 2-like [Branchiostoma belcheri]|uniref:Prokineticin receptor 2-like n=1 Tax=Branchiostoma belcheri TaxID=7741 RepID=A0A6P4ZRU7_BRABE|nr:PREDICTED: prokineticin receptor 2-like [Branchiostoma belcheri]